MIYTTGTIAGSGNTITGTGTNFTAAGSLIRAGCTLIAFTNPVQVLQLAAITNGTSLSVTPAISPAIAAGTKYAILLSDSLSVDGLAQDIAETFGMYQRYMGGFADVMNGTGDVTITINGQQVTVPGQKSVATKKNGRVPVEQGGTGEITLAAAIRAFGSDTVDKKSGGRITSSTDIESAANVICSSAGFGEMAFKFPGTMLRMAYAFTENYGDYVIATTAATVSGTEKYFSMRQDGNFNTQGAISCVSLTQTSDADKKDNVTRIPDALSKLEHIDGVTFNWKESGLPSAGVIAQKLIEVLPEAVGSVFDDHNHYELKEEVNEAGETVLVNHLVKPRDEKKRSYTVEYSGVVALLVAALKEESYERMLLEERVKKLEQGNSSPNNLHNV